MYPSKNNIMDYVTEFNRLFPNTNINNENDLFQIHNTFENPNFSPINQSIFTNQSSSSADSTSPDSYPDVSRRLCFETPRSSVLPHDSRDIPFGYRRAITGRKIIDNLDQRHILEPKVVPLERNCEEFEQLNFSYQSDDSAFFQHTPPNYYQTGAIPKILEPKHYRGNMYELFPAEKKGYEFHTPVKDVAAAQSFTSANVSPISSQMSQRTSPKFHNRSVDFPSRSFNFPNSSPKFPNNSPNFPNTSFNFPRQSPNFGNRYSNVDSFSFASTNSNQYRPQFSQVASSKLCTFCRKNGETAMVYSTHSVKEMIDGRYVVTCPILRSHVCSACNESGDNAHTITYCPVLRSSNNGRPLQSTTITLKNTRIKSNGKRRY